MYDLSLLSLSLYLRLSCTGKWRALWSIPREPPKWTLRMPHSLHFHLDHPKYILQIWCNIPDAVRDRETEAAHWPNISIIIGTPWKYLSSCGILVPMNEIRNFFPFLSQSSTKSGVFKHSHPDFFFFFFKPRVWKTFRFLYRSKFTYTFKHTYPYFMSLSGANSQCKGGPG